MNLSSTLSGFTHYACSDFRLQGLPLQFLLRLTTHLLPKAPISGLHVDSFSLACFQVSCFPFLLLVANINQNVIYFQFILYVYDPQHIQRTQHFTFHKNGLSHASILLSCLLVSYSNVRCQGREGIFCGLVIRKTC